MCIRDRYKVAEGSGDHAVIEPSYVGRFITLYSEPSGLGTTIDDLGVSAGSDVNATLAGDPSPDTRITGEAFAKWRLADFGITTKRDALNTIIEQKFPAVNYKLKVYFLSIGKWTFTKEEKENWDDREADRRLYGWFATWVWMCDSLFTGLGMLNPFRNFGSWGGLAAFLFFYMVLRVLAPMVLDRLVGPPRREVHA